MSPTIIFFILTFFIMIYISSQIYHISSQINHWKRENNILTSINVFTVPVHSNEIIGPGLLLKILEDCDLTKKEFQRLL